MKLIYLDHNSTTPLLPEVAEAMAEWQTTAFGNPSSQHQIGRRARQALHAWHGDVTQLNELDAWLRAEGHARNPGTSADLVTACLFVGVRAGVLNVSLHSFGSPQCKQG